MLIVHAFFKNHPIMEMPDFALKYFDVFTNMCNEDRNAF